MVVRVSEGKFLEILEAAPAIGLPIEVDVYDGGDPDTMLATIENAREVGFGSQLSETGAGKFTLNRHDAKATEAILADGNLVRVKVGGIYRFAYWIEEPSQVDLSASEASGEDRKLPGRGALAGLERARVYPPIWPPAAASYRSASVADNGAGATSLFVGKPAGAIAGDVVLIVVTCGGATPAAPTGWKRIRNTTNGSLRQTTFRKRLVAGEPASWKFTWTSSTAAIGQGVALANATGDDTQYGISDVTGSGTTIKLPSVNVGVVDGVLLGFAAVAATTAVTPAGGWSEVSDRASSGRTAEVARLSTSPALGDTGDVNFTAGSGAWVGMQIFVPSTGSTDAVFAGATLGGVLATLIDEAQARGALPWLTYDFDGVADSQGEPWPDQFDLSFHVGTSLLDVWRHLVSLGLEGEMTPALKLRAYVDMARHFEDTVVLRKGRHFVGELERRSHSSTLATRALVEGAGGRVVEVLEPTGTLEADLRIGRREGFVSMATSDDPTTIQRAGEGALELAALETQAIDLDVAHGPRTEGQYEPWVDYRNGDWISIELDPSTREPHRVVATNLEKTEDGYGVNLDLNAIELEQALRLQRKVDAITGGGGLGSSSGLGLGGSGGSGSAASTGGLVAVRPGDVAGYLADKLETDPATITKTIVGEVGSQRVRLVGIAPTTNLDGLTDVSVAGADAPTDGQALVYVLGAGLWKPRTISSLRYLGAWSGATAYVPNDVVQSGGSSYVAVLAGTNHVPPNATYWGLLASIGATGATGANGTNGTNGATFRDGTGAPSSGLGVNGDYYLEHATGDVYLKAAGTYSVVANLKGPTGATGATGAPGAATIIVEEVDGTPTDPAVTKLVFPNGTLTIVGHVATYTPTGGGGGGSDLVQTASGAGSVYVPDLRGSIDAIPASPSASDSEMESAAGWSTLGTLDVSSFTDVPSHWHGERNSAGAEVNGLYKAIPGGGMPFTVTAKIPAGDFFAAAGNPYVGLMLLDATPTALWTAGYAYASGYGWWNDLFVAAWSSRTVRTTGSDANVQVQYHLGVFAWLRLVVHSSTNVDVLYSPNGYFWIARSLGLNPGFTIANVGVFISVLAAGKVAALVGSVRFT